MAAAIAQSPLCVPLSTDPSATESLLDRALAQELFRLIPKDELEGELKHLDILDHSGVEVSLSLLRKPDFSDPFFEEEFWIERVLYLSIKGLLTAHEIAKLFPYRTVQEHTGKKTPQVCQIIQDNGEVDIDGWAYFVKQAFSPPQMRAIIPVIVAYDPTLVKRRWRTV